MDNNYNSFHNNYQDVKKEVTTEQEITVSTDIAQQHLVKHEINAQVEDDFYQHSDIKLEEPQVKIEPCFENLFYNSRVLRNERSSVLEKPYQCTYCDKGFYHVSMLEEHRRGHLIQHQRINHSENPYECTSCGQCFTKKDQLIQHRIQCIHECSQCGKSFRRLYRLKIHQQIHTGTGENIYKCNHCDKCYIRKGAMTLHINKQTLDTPLHCSHCTKSFNIKCELLKHQLSHISEKFFHCNYCDSSFARKYNLIKHEKVHTSNKPFNKNKLSK